MAYCNHRDPKIMGLLFLWSLTSREIADGWGLGTDVPYSRQETGTVSCPCGFEMLRPSLSFYELW